MANLSDHLVNYQSNDTLDSVTGRGATTTNNLTIGNLTSSDISASGNVTITITDSNYLKITHATRGDSDIKFALPGVAADTLGLYAGSALLSRWNASGDVSFYQTNSTSVGMLWDATNLRLGIDETNPSNPLHINAGATTVAQRIDTNITSSEGNVDFLQAYTTNGYASSLNLIRVGTTNTGLALKTTGSGTLAERMRIDNTGRVLIGTTATPSSTSPHLVIKNPNNTSVYMQMTGSGDAGGIILGTNPERSLVLYSYSGATGSESYGSPYMIMNGGGAGSPGSLQLGYDTPYPIRVDSGTFVYYPHSNTAHVAYYKRQTHPANSNEYHYYWRTSDTGSPGGANETTHMTLNTGSTHGGKLWLPGGVSFDSGFAAAHTLDDYEEGSWTPQLHDGTNTINLTGSHYYRKIGALVVATCSAYNFGITGLNTSHLRIQNLPFTASNQNNSAAIGRASSTTEPTVFMEVSGNSNFGYLYGKGNGSGANVLSYVKTYFQSASVGSIWITITYLTSP